MEGTLKHVTTSRHSKQGRKYKNDMSPLLQSSQTGEFLPILVYWQTQETTCFVTKDP